MNVNEAFKTYEDVVNADIDAVREARRRRDLFKDAFISEPDVDEVIASGSLRRGTHKDPIHDVDVIVVFDAEEHGGWGQPGASAEEALEYTRERVNALLGATNGTFQNEVRLARWRNHAVKCFLDDPDDPDAFTVDAMPALRSDGMLLVPEAVSRKWILTNPEHLIAAVAGKHAEWNKFAGSVRMLKAWAIQQDIKIKSLVMEVLALQHMPTGQSQPSALKEFFVKAAYDIEAGIPVVDPAGVCGPIQPDLDYDTFARCLRASADLAGQAVTAQINRNPAGAIARWGDVFGEGFPEPPAGATSAAGAAVVTPRPVKDTPQG